MIGGERDQEVFRSCVDETHEEVFVTGRFVCRNHSVRQPFPAEKFEIILASA